MAELFIKRIMEPKVSVIFYMDKAVPKQTKKARKKCPGRWTYKILRQKTFHLTYMSKDRYYLTIY